MTNNLLWSQRRVEYETRFVLQKCPALEKSATQCQSDNLNSAAMSGKGERHAYLNKNVTPA